MLRNLIINPGSGSFPIFISARGDRWFSITHRHRCCRGVTLFSCTFHSFISFSTSGLISSLNLWFLSKLNTPQEHPETRSILTMDWHPWITETSNGKTFKSEPWEDLQLIFTPLRMYWTIVSTFSWQMPVMMALRLFAAHIGLAGLAPWSSSNFVILAVNTRLGSVRRVYGPLLSFCRFLSDAL